MELTYEEVEKMIEERLTKFPELNAIVQDAAFRKTLEQILSFEHIDLDFLPLVEGQLKIVLAFYAPITELPQRIQENLEITEESAERIVSLIETLLLNEVRDDLYVFAEYMRHELEADAALPDAKSGLKEKLELRPDVVTGVENTALKDPHMSVQPLTRESILNTLSPKRTMAEDIAELKEKKELPHQGYESYVAAKETKE